MVQITIAGSIMGCVWTVAMSVLLLLVVHASPALGRGPGPGYQRRLLESTGYDVNESPSSDSLIELQDDVWGPVVEERSEREKRLFKPKSLGVGASVGAAVGKQVASKAFNTVKQGVVKKILGVSSSSSSSSAGKGIKVAKTVGTKAAKAATVIGIKTLLLNLVFGKINQLIEWKTKLLDNLEKQNRAKNQQFLKPSTSAATPSDSPSATSNAGSPPRDGETDQEFDPEKITLNVPDELFAPAFNSINSVSTIIGNVIQNTAERLARFIEAIKPLLRRKLGLQSSKRDTINDSDDTEEPPASYSFQTSFSSKDTKSGTSESNSDNKSTIKSSYTALIHKR
ncbi:uncharacterized protein LOC142320112 [Lycorma delicatula]|uniref:uncharacterized protein LOC142320112 n=1 Tax=Lycorma delicatula TaxID=130591 RepID=UPI003F5126F9